MVPTAEKPHVDEQPYLSDDKIAPVSLVDEASKAKTRLGNKGATADEIYRFLRVNPKIHSYDELETHLDNAPHSDLAVKRVNKFINNNICKAKDVITRLIERRGHKMMETESRRKPRWYLRQAVQQTKACTCPQNGKTNLFDDINFLVDFHGQSTVQPFFVWVDKFFGDTLPRLGRPRNCFFLGSPSSGKSPLTDLVTNILPKFRIFGPTLESSAPYAALRPHHLLSVTDDWRFSGKVPITATLQWLEGREFGVDIKGKDPFVLKCGPCRLYSSNRDNNTATWQQVDIEAFRERCYIVHLDAKIPLNYRRPDVGAKAKCTHCIVRVLAKFAPSVKKVWEAKFPGKPNGATAIEENGKTSGEATEQKQGGGATEKEGDTNGQATLETQNEEMAGNAKNAQKEARGGFDSFDDPFGEAFASNWYEEMGEFPLSS